MISWIEVDTVGAIEQAKFLRRQQQSTELTLTALEQRLIMALRLLGEAQQDYERNVNGREKVVKGA